MLYIQSLYIKAFAFGYTIASIIATLGTGTGILFSTTTMLLQNIIIIPVILAIGVSGTRLYNSILKDKRRENVKLEIYRHSIFSSIVSVPMILSSFIEVYISTQLLMYTVKYL